MTITESKVPSIEGISKDSDRINALYAPFRPRDANPESYDRKMKFWVKAVEEFGLHCKKVSFTLKELQNEFRISGKAPACLPDVIDEIHRKGMILPEKDFYENLKSAESWKNWSLVVASKVVRRVGSYVPSPITYFYRPAEDEIRYISVEQLKTLTERVLGEPSLVNKLVNVATWTSKVTELTQITEPADIEYLRGYLKSKKCLIVDQVGSEDVIMMSAIGAQPNISDVEKGKYDIVRTKEILETQLHDLNEKKTQAKEKAVAALKQGFRSTAKHELRRKNLLEQRTDKLLTMVDNLSVLESQIEDAQSDAALISTYETGKKALKDALADKRLNADHVTETMLDIQDLLEEHADINAALSQPMDNQDADLADLEKELDELLEEDNQKADITQPSPAPTSVLSKEEEEEVINSLKALELDGLDDLSKLTLPRSKNVDTSGD